MKADAIFSTHKPLAGKLIVITRAPQQAPAFSRALADAGASVIHFPCVDFVAPKDWGPLDSALSRIQQFDWLVFTSQNAVLFFRQRQFEIDPARSGLASRRPKIAALGAATAKISKDAGLLPDFTASDARSGSEFVAAFAPLARGKKVLLPQSDHAGDGVAASLSDAGAIVTSVVAYRTCVPELLDGNALDRIQREAADIIFFASPSAFHNFAQMIGDEKMKQLAKHCVFGAIGPTTARAIRGAGVPVGFESSLPNTDAILKAMEEFFAAQVRTKVRQ